jgi:hypothetical protein
MLRKLIIISIIFLTACSPVNRVLNNKKMFDKVAEEVIRRNYCINDTITVETTKDSVVYKDSLIEKTFNVPCPDFEKNLPDGTLIKISSGVLTYRHNCKEKEVIRTVTKTNNIRDRALENILKGDITKRDTAIAAYIKLLNDSQIANSELKKENLNLVFRFWGIIAIAVVIIFRKQIFKLINAFI